MIIKRNSIKNKSVSIVELNTLEKTIIFWRYGKNGLLTNFNKYNLTPKNEKLFYTFIHKTINDELPYNFYGVEIYHHFDSNIGSLAFHINYRVSDI